MLGFRKKQGSPLLYIRGDTPKQKSRGIHGIRALASPLNRSASLDFGLNDQPVEHFRFECIPFPRVKKVLRRRSLPIAHTKSDAIIELCKSPKLKSVQPILMSLIAADELQHVIDNKYTDKQETMLHVAACRGDLAAVQALVEIYNANISIQNKSGVTALQAAQREIDLRKTQRANAKTEALSSVVTYLKHIRLVIGCAKIALGEEEEEYPIITMKQLDEKLQKWRPRPGHVCKGESNVIKELRLEFACQIQNLRKAKERKTVFRTQLPNCVIAIFMVADPGCGSIIDNKYYEFKVFSTETVTSSNSPIFRKGMEMEHISLPAAHQTLHVSVFDDRMGSLEEIGHGSVSIQQLISLGQNTCVFLENSTGVVNIHCTVIPYTISEQIVRAMSRAHGNPSQLPSNSLTRSSTSNFFYSDSNKLMNERGSSTLPVPRKNGKLSISQSMFITFPNTIPIGWADRVVQELDMEQKVRRLQSLAPAFIAILQIHLKIKRGEQINKEVGEENKHEGMTVEVIEKIVHSLEEKSQELIHRIENVQLGQRNVIMVVQEVCEEVANVKNIAINLLNDLRQAFSASRKWMRNIDTAQKETRKLLASTTEGKDRGMRSSESVHKSINSGSWEKLKTPKNRTQEKN